MKNKSSPKSLYVHIPFCSHICEYCDFVKLFYNQKFVDDYIAKLLEELASYNIDKVDTIYVGGGTPSSLDEKNLEKLLKALKPHLASDAEFSLEANVENLTARKLDIALSYGVNRLSLGVQSTNDKTLKFLGRKHSFKDVVKIIDIAKEKGLNNISVDLIYGLPKETKEDLEKDILNILGLNIDHISVYSLTIPPTTMFFKKGYKPQNEDESRLHYDMVLSLLRKHGYERYEISNFTRNKRYSRHNLTYWHNETYYAIGLGACGYIDNYRYENTKSLASYLRGDYIAAKEYLTKQDEMDYYLITNLRLEKGVSKSVFKELYSLDFDELYLNKLESLPKQYFKKYKHDKIVLSDEGLMLLDQILLTLL